MIFCEEIINAISSVSTNVTNTIPTNVTNIISTNGTSTASTNHKKQDIKWTVIFWTQLYY